MASLKTPNGDWIAYHDSSGQKCILVHPDGTGARTLKAIAGRIFGYRVFGWRIVWSPDGQQVLLNQMKGDGPNLDVLLVDVRNSRSVVKVKNGLPVFGWSRYHKGSD